MATSTDNKVGPQPDELEELRAELLEARETIASNRETIDSLRAQLADADKTREGRCRTSSPEP